MSQPFQAPTVAQGGFRQTFQFNVIVWADPFCLAHQGQEVAMRNVADQSTSYQVLVRCQGKDAREVSYPTAKSWIQASAPPQVLPADGCPACRGDTQHDRSCRTPTLRGRTVCARNTAGG